MYKFSLLYMYLFWAGNLCATVPVRSEDRPPWEAGSPSSPVGVGCEPPVIQITQLGSTRLDPSLWVLVWIGLVLLFGLVNTQG